MTRTGRGRPRRIRLVQAALVVTWVAGALALPGPTDDRQELRMLAAPSGNPLGLSNSKNGVAILGASNMRPGDSATGTVTLTNTGNVDSELSLQKANLRDTAGPGGGPLSEVLQLQLQDVTKPVPVTLYSGRLATMPPIALGAFPKKAAGRTYRFTVTLPRSAGDRYERSTARVDYVWTQTKSNGNGPKGK